MARAAIMPAGTCQPLRRSCNHAVRCAAQLELLHQGSNCLLSQHVNAAQMLVAGIRKCRHALRPLDLQAPNAQLSVQGLCGCTAALHAECRPARQLDLCGALHGDWLHEHGYERVCRLTYQLPCRELVLPALLQRPTCHNAQPCYSSATRCTHLASR